MQSEWFKTRMFARRLSQEAVAEKLGRDRSQVSRIMTGAQPLKLAEIEPLAEILGVSPIELIWRAGDWHDAQLIALARAWSRLPPRHRRMAVGLVEQLAADLAQPPPEPDADESPPALAQKRGRR